MGLAYLPLHLRHLDGTSTIALREQFLAWAMGDVARQGLEKYDPETIARYSYFV